MKTSTNSHNGLKILIDYCCFTVKLDVLYNNRYISSDDEYSFGNEEERSIVEIIENDLCLGGNRTDSDRIEWITKRGFYGYNKSYLSNGIVFCFGGRDDVYIQMSGTGCRFWETINPGKTWYTYFWYLRARCGTQLHFSRLDVACDTFGILNVDLIKSYVKDKKYVSKWRCGLYKYGFMENEERTIIFGSTKSDFMLRIYDKTAERKHYLKVAAEDIPKDWVRCEFQMRDKVANAFINSYNTPDIGSLYFGVMYDYLRFYEFYDGRNADRMVICTWWKKFLSGAKRVKLTYEGGTEYNLENLKNYIFKQAGSSIHAYLQTEGFDLQEFISIIEQIGLNDKQKQLKELQRRIDDKE